MLRYKKYTLIKPDNQQRERIAKIIEDKNGSIFQEFDLNSIVQKHFNTDFYYLVDNPKRIENLSPIHVQKGRMGIKRYHFKPLYDIPYAGFIDDNNINLKEISVGLFESCAYYGLPSIKNTSSKKAEFHGETSFIDLTLDEDQIFNEIIHSKRRNMIRKANKSGIDVRTYSNEKGLQYLWPILEELHSKLGYEHLKKEYYADIINTLGLTKKAYILVAFKEEKPLSGVIILGNKNFMTYYKGASWFGIKNEGQGELLQWEAIKLSKSNNVSFYDLGNLDRENLPSIYKFKTGISNNIVNYPVYSIHSFGYKVIKKMMG